MAHYPNSSPAVLDPALEASLPMETSPDAIATATTGLASVEQQADRVMDDLFGDMERSLLEGSTLPQTWVEEEETPPVSPLQHLDLSQPGPLVNRQAPVAAAETSEANVSALALPQQDEALDALAHPPNAPESSASSKAFDRLLLAIATLALVGTGAVWFALQARLQQVSTAVATAPAVTTPTVSQADRDFLDYVERSLGVIDRKVEIRRQTEAIASNPAAQLPPVAVAGGTPNTSAGGTVLERIYVPVYQPPQSFNLPTAAVPSLPQQPVIPGQAAGQAATEPSRAIAPPGAAIAPAPAPSVAPAPTTTLIGVLELGNRSAALFEFNGTTRRIQIGEPIGASGWTLVSVRNQDAIIRRNGEVRSISVGQRF